jgi:hypothetical protein
MSDEHQGQTWPEQDATLKWWSKHSEELMGAVSEYRIKKEREIEAALADQTALYQQIEELERERDEAERELWYPPDGVYITHDQIKAAWDKTEELRASLKRLGQFEVEILICNAREELMKELNIKRCEGCDGAGVKRVPRGHVLSASLSGGRLVISCDSLLMQMP